jgi:hypothetical protein
MSLVKYSPIKPNHRISIPMNELVDYQITTAALWRGGRRLNGTDVLDDLTGTIRGGVTMSIRGTKVQYEGCFTSPSLFVFRIGDRVAFMNSNGHVLAGNIRAYCQGFVHIEDESGGIQFDVPVDNLISMYSGFMPVSGDTVEILIDGDWFLRKVVRIYYSRETGSLHCTVKRLAITTAHSVLSTQHSVLLSDVRKIESSEIKQNIVPFSNNIPIDEPVDYQLNTTGIWREGKKINANDVRDVLTGILHKNVIMKIRGSKIQYAGLIKTGADFKSISITMRVSFRIDGDIVFAGVIRAFYEGFVHIVDDSGKAHYDIPVEKVISVHTEFMPRENDIVEYKIGRTWYERRVVSVYFKKDYGILCKMRKTSPSRRISIGLLENIRKKETSEMKNNNNNSTDADVSDYGEWKICHKGKFYYQQVKIVDWVNASLADNVIISYGPNLSIVKEVPVRDIHPVGMHLPKEGHKERCLIVAEKPIVMHDIVQVSYQKKIVNVKIIGLPDPALMRPNYTVIYMDSNEIRHILYYPKQAIIRVMPEEEKKPQTNNNNNNSKESMDISSDIDLEMEETDDGANTFTNPGLFKNLDTSVHNITRNHAYKKLWSVQDDSVPALVAVDDNGLIYADFNTQAKLDLFKQSRFSIDKSDYDFIPDEEYKETAKDYTCPICACIVPLDTQKTVFHNAAIDEDETNNNSDAGCQTFFCKDCIWKTFDKPMDQCDTCRPEYDVICSTHKGECPLCRGSLFTKDEPKLDRVKLPSIHRDSLERLKKITGKCSRCDEHMTYSDFYLKHIIKGCNAVCFLNACKMPLSSNSADFRWEHYKKECLALKTSCLAQTIHYLNDASCDFKGTIFEVAEHLNQCIFKQLAELLDRREEQEEKISALREELSRTENDITELEIAIKNKNNNNNNNNNDDIPEVTKRRIESIDDDNTNKKAKVS